MAVVSGRAPLDVPCGTGGTVVPADWYAPAPGSPPATGLVWLQHGFVSTSANVAALARSITASTGTIVVAPTISSNPFAPGRCWINGAPMWRAVAALLAERSPLQTSADAAFGRPTGLPDEFVLAGHSAGGNLVTAAAGDMTLGGRAIAGLKGVVLFDAVDYARGMQRALQRLTGADARPVLQIASPPNPCNAYGTGTSALLAARPGAFVGVQLVNGTHLDAEGADSGPLDRAVCGTPLPANAAALRTLAADWITNDLTGSSLGITGGAPGESIAVGAATAIVLPAS